MMHQHPTHHHQQFLHPSQMHHQVNMNQPPPPTQLNCPAPHMPNISSQNPQNSQQANQPPHQRDSGRMNHHHQRMSHQQIHQQQMPPPQGTRMNQNLNHSNQHIHGMMMGQQQQNPQPPQQNPHPPHQPPPQMMPKHLHQNIATLNQKPQHMTSSNSSSHQTSTRLMQSIEKSGQTGPPPNMKQRDNTATLSNNSSIVVSSQSASSAIAATPPPQISQNALTAVNVCQQQVPAMMLNPNSNISGGVKTSSTGGSFELNKNLNLSNNKENLSLIMNSNNLNNCNAESGSISTIDSHLQSITIDNDSNNTNDKGLDHLANTKEKTPMCLVNELARYNKIQHQYRLTGEQGPAHKKRFTVTLKLGDEEYTAEGLSIKKAQHAAAKEAITKTVYKHPPVKTNRQNSRLTTKNNSGSNITPTVELNALAMKRGEPTVYTVEPLVLNNSNLVTICPQHPQCNQNHQPQQQQQQQQQQPQQPQQYVAPNNQPPYNNYNNRNNYPHKFANNFRGPGHFGGRFNNHYGETYRVTLQVGSRTFTGMGVTQQAARHDAAARALEVLKPLTSDNENSGNSKNVSLCGSENGDTSECNDSLINSEIKSPISIVHEMALKRKLFVLFEVQSEKGPPHMKTYTTICKVGTIVTEGEGNGKKLSKKKAAEKMVEELKKLPPPSPVEEVNRTNVKTRRKQQQQQQVVTKKKSRNLIKEKSDQNFVEEINPISQLIQIQQARKEKEPCYTVVDERGTARRREFVIEVSASGMSATGAGPNKKMAKRIAAEKLLQLMGVGKTSLISGQEPTTPNSNKKQEDKSKKVQFIEPTEVVVKKSKSPSTPSTPATTTSNNGGTNGRQIVPGMYIVSQEAFDTPQPKQNPKKEPPQTPVQQYEEPPTEKSVSSPNSSSASNNDSGIGDGGVSPRDQLNYLAQLIGFSVSYSDFPKGNHGEYLSLVTLTTDPPHMSHGNGNNIEESRDKAALTALSIISDIGLDNIKPKRSNASPNPQSGDSSDKSSKPISNK